MKRQTLTQKGFTLVELAIVMTIIGLLIGGILKGQELMQTARVTATVAQIKAFEASITNFRDSFGGSIPGDMPNGQQRLQGCTLGCNNTVVATLGDNIVGATAWDTGYASQGGGITSGAVAAGTQGAETWQFWAHLERANLLSGVNASGLNTATAYSWGVTHPAARIAGGFIVGNTNGVIPPGSTNTVANSGPSGLVLALVLTPTSVVNNTAGQQPLPASRAAQIDRKMDDGLPTLGDIQAFGVAATTVGLGGCMITGTTTYNEAGTTNACGILIRVQG